MSVNTKAEQPVEPEVHAPQEFDVAIIGHGPSGVIAANLLGKEGVRTLAVERDKDLYNRARAVTVNDWTLRIFQDMGIDEKCKLDMDATDGVNFKTYGGKIVFRLGIHEPRLSQPPAMMIYQPSMEADLRSVGAEIASLDIRYGHTFGSLTQDPHGVTLQLTDDAGKPYEARAKYVIGADGGQSPVRESLGIELIGDTRPRRWIVIDGEVLDWWADCNTLNLWSDSTRPMVDIPLAKGNHRWEIPLNEGERDEDFDDEEAVWALLRPLGIDENHVRIKGWAFYSHHVRHATRWREGRVVLVGDAAHLMPPWAGQGMQSGMRDAANAAWKVALLARGLAEDSLLDTVESERRPHVEKMTKMATTLGSIVEAAHPVALAVRDNVAPLVMKIPGLDNAVAPGFETYCFSDGWVTGKPGRRSALGRMIPQPYVYSRQAIATRLDDVVGYGFTIFGLDRDPRQAMSVHQVDAWERLGARFVTVVRKNAAAGAGELVVDHTGALRKWMKKFCATVVAVRPDHFVAATDKTGLDVPASLSTLTTRKESVR